MNRLHQQIVEDIKTHLGFLNFQRVVSKELKECDITDESEIKIEKDSLRNNVYIQYVESTYVDSTIIVVQCIVDFEQFLNGSGSFHPSRVSADF